MRNLDNSVVSGAYLSSAIETPVLPGNDGVVPARSTGDIGSLARASQSEETRCAAALLVSTPFYASTFSIVNEKIVDKNGKISPKIRQIFEMFKEVFIAAHTGPRETIQAILENDQPLLQDFNRLAQENFLRPTNSERVDPKAQAHYQQLCAHLSSAQKTDIIQLFKEVGDIDAVYPLYKTPNYILIQGATVHYMRERLMFLAELVSQQRIYLSPTVEIMFLVGERSLSKEESPQALTSTAPFNMREGWQPTFPLPTDEREVAKMVWEQLDLPAVLRDKVPIFIEAVKTEDHIRAQTEDCVRTWIEHSQPQPGNCMIISSNPFVYYQMKITEMVLAEIQSEGFTLEGVGSRTPIEKYPLDLAIGVLMDNLARTLYVEARLKEITK